MHPANAQTQWHRVLIDGLASAGVSDVIVCPGSRSTPLVCAALADTRLRCASVLDERSAAFYALGQAKVSRRATAVICTSGSAGAHMFPAVMEAHAAGLPLVILTADRPPALHGIGANQTTDQQHLFGVHTRLFEDLGIARVDESSLRALRAKVQMAVAKATHPGGVAHLNVPASKPLEPIPSRTEEELALERLCDAICADKAGPGDEDETSLDEADLAPMLETLSRAKRPLIVCGPQVRAGAHAALCTLASGGVPVVVDGLSAYRYAPGAGEHVFGAHEVLWNADVRGVLDADVVLQLGRPLVATAWLEMIERVKPTLLVASEEPWREPTRRASMRVAMRVDDAIKAIANKFSSANIEPGWLSLWQSAERSNWERAEAACESDVLHEGTLTRLFFDVIKTPTDALVGNSLCARNVGRWVKPKERPLRLHAQRGLSGIDGLIAGAVGMSSKGKGPTALLLGDVSFLHDVGSLQLTRSLQKPVVVVVVNNGGGRIFEQLPIADALPDALDFFTTPTVLDATAWAKAAGVAACRVDTVSAFLQVYRRALETGGCTVIDAVVPPDSARSGYDRLVSGARAEWTD